MGVDVPPSGSSGLMLGEIFGRNAGLTCTEVVLLRVLPLRPRGLGSARLPDIDPPGEGDAPS